MGNRALKLRIWRRDGVRCRYCGTQLRIPPTGTPSHDDRDATVDHVVPVAKGGRTVFHNLLTVCRRCNMSKATSDALDYRLSRAPAPSPNREERGL